MKREIVLKAVFQIFLVISLIFVFAVNSSALVYADDRNVCCEKSVDGDYCQYTSESNCDPDMRVWDNTCENLDPCLPVCCDVNNLGYYGSGGLGCYKEVSRNVCLNDLGGDVILNSQCEVPQCEIGCCLIGNQAMLTTELSCRDLTSDYPDLEMDYREDVVDELECLNIAREKVRGCCVSEQGDGRKDCSLVTFGECTEGYFYDETSCVNLPDDVGDCDHCKRDSGESYRRDCAPEIDGGEDVYFYDLCDNPILGSNTGDNDCDYGMGTLCRVNNETGEGECRDLNCDDLWDNKFVDENFDGIYDNDDNFNGRNIRLNGESWCEYDADAGPARDLPGTRHYVHTCYEGEEVILECEDYREEFCIEFSGLMMSQAACKSNRAAIEICSDCEDADCCKNAAMRDCIWVPVNRDEVVEDVRRIEEQRCSEIQANCPEGEVCECPESTINNNGDSDEGKCIPIVPPGTRGEDTLCNAGDITSDDDVKSYWSTQGFGDGWDCDAGCDIYTNKFAYEQNIYCRSLGDCGADFNLVGEWTNSSFSRGGCDVDYDYGLEDVEQGGEDYKRDYGPDEQAESLIDDCLETLPDPGSYSPKAESFTNFSKYKNILRIDVPSDFAAGILAAEVIGWVGVGVGAALAVTLVLVTWGGGFAAGTTVAATLGVGAATAGTVPVIGWIVAVVILIIAVVFLVTSDTDTNKVTIDCKAWAPPLHSNDCHLCHEPGERTFIKPDGTPDEEHIDLTAGGLHYCTDYLCWSLGQCEYFETDEGPRCLPLECGRDTNSPKRMFFENITNYNPDACRRGNDPAAYPVTDCSEEEVTVVNIVEDYGHGGYDVKYIKENTDFVVGLNTSELAVCKWDWEMKSNFDEMGNYFDQSNLALEHTITLDGDDDLEPGINKTMHVICRDRCGNPQGLYSLYTIDLEVSNMQDFGAPLFLDIEPKSGSPVRAENTFTDVTLYLNEKAHCKWSRTNDPYWVMPHSEINCNRVTDGCDLRFTDLANGTNTFYIRCNDYSNNSNMDSLPDNNGYTIIRSDPLNITSFGCLHSFGDGCGTIYDRNFTLEVVTLGGGYNDRATCFARSDNGFEYEFLNTNSSLHTQVLNARGTGDHSENVRCVDDVGNEDSIDVSYHTIVDDDEPRILRVTLEGDSLNVLTDEEATCKHAGNTTVIYDNMNEFDSTGGTLHSVSFTDKDYLHVKCGDRFNHVVSWDVYRAD